MHILEALLDLAFDVFVRGSFQVNLVEKGAVFVANEVKYLALGEGRHDVTVLAVTVEKAVYLDLAVKQDKKVVLVGLVDAALATTELDVLLKKHLLLALLEVACYRLLLQHGLVDEEQLFFLKENRHEGVFNR